MSGNPVSHQVLTDPTATAYGKEKREVTAPLRDNLLMGSSDKPLERKKKSMSEPPN